MNRAEFEQLRNLPKKRIVAYIEFVAAKNTVPNLVFEGIAVENDLGWEGLLNGTYRADVPSISFNFVVGGTGPICRLEVNGPLHPGPGSTHKHELRREDDPRQNLPRPTSRPDLA